MRTVISKELGVQVSDITNLKKFVNKFITFEVMNKKYWAKLTPTGKLAKNSFHIDID